MKWWVKLILVGAVGAAITGSYFFAMHWFAGQIEASFLHGREVERASWEQLEKDRATAQLAANKTESIRQNNVNRKVADNGNDQRAQVRSEKVALAAELAAVGGMRITPAAYAAFAAPGGAAGDGDHDATLAASIQLPASIEQDLRAEAERADLLVEQLREAQDWILQHGFYPAPSAASAAVQAE